MLHSPWEAGAEPQLTPLGWGWWWWGMGKTVPLLLFSVSTISTSSLKIGIELSYGKIMFLWHSQVYELGSIPATELLLSWPLSFYPSFWESSALWFRRRSLTMLRVLPAHLSSHFPRDRALLPLSINSGRTQSFAPSFHSLGLKVSCVGDHIRQQKYNKEQTSSFSPEDCILKVRDTVNK